MNQLPDNRDSTDYITQTIPGLLTGHEQFSGVVAVNDFLFVAYNGGFSAWDPSNDPDNPGRVAVRDGWAGHWLEFALPGEADTLVIDIAAEPLSGGEVDGDVLVAVAGRDLSSIALWHFDVETREFTPLYQGTNNSQYTVDTATYNGRVYVFGGASNGVWVYDASAALEGEPCVEDLNAPSCPGVSLGRLADTGNTFNVSAQSFARDGSEHLLVAAQRLFPSEDTLRLYELSDPSAPQQAELRSGDYGGVANGVQLFAKDEQPYLGVANYVAAGDPASVSAEVYALDACLGAACSLTSPVASSAPKALRLGRKTLHHSLDDRDNADPSDDEHFLYVAPYQSGAVEAQEEYIFHLRGLSPDPGQNEEITTLTSGGPTYLDACLNEEVGYFGWGYSTHEFGLRNVGPSAGVFLKDRFYRAAGGVFDIHIWTRTDPVMPEPGDGDGDPGDGDGDPTTGDGDGDPTAGDGDEDPATGDGDGDPSSGSGESSGDEGGSEETGPGLGEAGGETGCACALDEQGSEPRGGLGFALLTMLGLAGLGRRRAR